MSLVWLFLQMVWDKLDAKFWTRQKELAIRLAQQKLEEFMRRHLRVGGWMGAVRSIRG